MVSLSTRIGVCIRREVMDRNKIKKEKKKAQENTTRVTSLLRSGCTAKPCQTRDLWLWRPPAKKEIQRVNWLKNKGKIKFKCKIVGQRSSSSFLSSLYFSKLSLASGAFILYADVCFQSTFLIDLRSLHRSQSIVTRGLGRPVCEQSTS